mmetsp:Transcript_25155/g.70744  ORF Transcript_25155/g.70744 Transcript_25155/m.70744 type:complete len:310 (-) Transcript_25155:136-1065(-)
MAVLGPHPAACGKTTCGEVGASSLLAKLAVAAWLDAFFVYLFIALRPIGQFFELLRIGYSGTAVAPTVALAPVASVGAPDAKIAAASLRGAAMGADEGAEEGEAAEDEDDEEEEGEEVPTRPACSASRATPNAMRPVRPPPPTFVQSVTASMGDVAAQVRAISLEAFEEDAMQTRRGERVAAMLRSNGQVVAYASYAVRPQSASLNINKLAVAWVHRRKGLGRGLIRFLIQLAKQPAQKAAGQRKSGGGGSRGSTLEVVCLSSLPTAVMFYAACGFREDRNVGFGSQDASELIEGQVYMEYSLRKRQRK